MAALQEIARQEASILRQGVLWIIVYRNGRSWASCDFYGDIVSDGFQDYELFEALKILRIDPDAVLINGDSCCWFSPDSSIKTISDGIKWCYENGIQRLRDNKVLPEYLSQILGSAVEIMHEIIDVIADLFETVKKIIDDVVESVKSSVISVISNFVPARWKHLYLCSKRARIRKKYCKKIMIKVFSG